MAAAQSSSEVAHDGKLCVICCQFVEYYALGRCDHPVCYKCGIRMRILCEERICSVCRTEMPQLIIIKDSKPFSTIKTKGLVKDQRNGIVYDSGAAEELVSQLLEHKCSVCKDRPPDRTFKQLREHIKKEHSLYYCDICVEHLKIFSHEFKIYTCKQLATHRRSGDPDDTSHKGHPLCEFCDVRFLDKDELMRHLRKNHLWCHFCEKDGSQDYYCDYDSLREHFREVHFLCEEGECVHEKFTAVFRTQIDIQAHIVTAHSKNMSKALARQNRQLDVDITYTRRARNDEQSYRWENRPYQSGAREGGRGTSARGPKPSDGAVGTGRAPGKSQRRSEYTGAASYQDTRTRADPRTKRPNKDNNPRNKTSDKSAKEEKPNKATQPGHQKRDSPSPELKQETNKTLKTTESNVNLNSNKTQGDTSMISVEEPAQKPADSMEECVSMAGPGLGPQSDFPSLPSESEQPPTLNILEPNYSKFINKTSIEEQDFPTLGGNSQSMSSMRNSSGEMFSKALKLSAQDFPRLGTASAADLAAISSLSMRDFPSLSNKSLPVSRPPPGLNSKRPPPGLPPKSTPLPPPPGLPIGAIAPIATQAKAPPSMNQYEYSLPTNYQERNKELITTIQGILGQEKFLTFKAQSGEFRRGVIDASHYYNTCRQLFGQHLKRVFHELVALLPDPEKQQELLTAYNDAKVLAKQSGENVVKIAVKSNEKATPWQRGDSFTSCPHCKQFLSQKDLESHLKVHTTDQEFPTLSAVYPSRAPLVKQGAKVAWVKGK